MQLQTAESHIRRLEAELQDIPKRKAELEAALTAEGGRLAAAREQLAQAQKRRRQNEASLQDLETRRSKYKGQLMDVKTNKEYQAMLHEIEGVEREIRGIEDKILEDMEAAETLAADVAREERLFKEAEREHATAIKDLEARSQGLQSQHVQGVAERDAVATTLPSELLERFRRVARLRGSGVAEARNGMCLECRMVLRPQMYVELKHNEEIVECPSCSRILFYEPPPVSVVP
jgi:uncharacterized protein